MNVWRSRAARIFGAVQVLPTQNREGFHLFAAAVINFPVGAIVTAPIAFYIVPAAPGYFELLNAFLGGDLQVVLTLFVPGELLPFITGLPVVKGSCSIEDRSGGRIVRQGYDYQRKLAVDREGNQQYDP